MWNRNVTTAVPAGILTFGAMACAQAQQPINTGQRGAGPSGWSFNVAPYGWFATIGSTASLGQPAAARGTVTAARGGDGDAAPKNVLALQADYGHP